MSEGKRTELTSINRINTCTAELRVNRSIDSECGGTFQAVCDNKSEILTIKKTL